MSDVKGRARIAQRSNLLQRESTCAHFSTESRSKELSKGKVSRVRGPSGRQEDQTIRQGRRKASTPLVASMSRATYHMTAPVFSAKVTPTDFLVIIISRSFSQLFLLINEMALKSDCCFLPDTSFFLLLSSAYHLPLSFASAALLSACSILTLLMVPSRISRICARPVTLWSPTMF